MKFHTQPPDVLIAGAGPVGLFAALNLARHRVPLRIIDKAPGPGVHSYALALHPATLDLLEPYGVTESILRFANPIHRIAIYAEHARLAEIDLRSIHTRHPFLAVLPQSALESILIEALARENVVVEWNHRLAALHLEPDEVTGSIERRAQRMMGYATSHLEWMVDEVRSFHVPYLIGADGHQSNTRKMAQIPFPPTRAKADFAVFEFETREPVEPEVKLVFTGELLNVCWPLNAFRCRWSFQLPARHGLVDEREKERAYVQVGDSHFQLVNTERIRELLAHRAPFFSPQVQRVDWRMIVRFAPALADFFTEGNLCLVGDAAHVAHPAGVQSMNRGLREAAGLSEVLVRILRDGVTLDSLESWALGARGVWSQHFGAAPPEPQASLDPRLLPHCATLPHVLPALGPDLSSLLAQLSVSMPASTARVAG
jgi:2-polyprenyl-6-methoxyphenol hydroxylase-like FAD-dependent oxidoreductase